MYGKLFRQMYKGTLAMVGPWEALVTFQQFIVLADMNGIIDMTPDAISRETTIPIEVIRRGIEALERPDPESRTPDEEGRRIVRLREHSTWGWRIVNYLHYRRIQSEEDRSDYQKRYYQTVTKPKRQQIQSVSTDSIHSRHAEVDAEVDAEGIKNTTAAAHTEFDEIKAVYPKRAGSNPWNRALKACNARLAQGGNWAAMVDGSRRYAEFCKSTGKVGTEYVMQAATFFGPDQRYLEPWTLPAGAGSDCNEACSLYRKLIETNGAARTPAIQAALDKIGGWQRVKLRTDFDAAKIEREFCKAYEAPHG